MSEALLATAVGSGALAVALLWQAWQLTGLEPNSPSRLVSELRLAQFSALLLVLAAGTYMGLAVAHEHTAGTGLDIALTIGFFVIAAVVTTWEPTHALTALALAWGAHALVDLAHMMNYLPSAIVPSWYATGCAIADVGIAAVCYFPVLKR